MSQEHADKPYMDLFFPATSVREIYNAKLSSAIEARNWASLMEYINKGIDEVSLSLNSKDGSNYVVNVKHKAYDIDFDLMTIDKAALVAFLQDLMDDKEPDLPSVIKKLDDGHRIILHTLTSNP